jgi:NAD(P)-dependent dehydrogenase (short-subunit alcohol dehydrogenase family)
MGKAAIVTGASRGIGRSIARRLASDGFPVVVNYSSNVKAAEDVVAEIQSAGGAALAIPADISQPTQVVELFRMAEEALGPIHVVVNSAGIMPITPIKDNDLAAFDKVMATNLRGAFLVLAQAAQHVIEGGRIVSLSAVWWQSRFRGTVRISLRNWALRALFECSAMNCAAAALRSMQLRPALPRRTCFWRGKVRHR